MTPSPRGENRLYSRTVTSFRESQRFRQPWLLGLFALTLLFSLWTAWRVELPDVMTLAVCVPLGALFVWILAVELVTEVRPEGLYIKFRMMWPERIIPYDQIVSAEAQTYRPILQYGGWGVRGIFPVKAFNVSGNRGVLLTLRNGRTLMVGSQRAKQLAAAVQDRLRLARPV